MLRMGCSKVDITPKIPVYLRGYAGRTELSGSVEDRLSAGVMLLSQGRTVVLVLTLDNLGLGINECERIYRDLYAETRLRPEQIFLACSHTHFAPGLSDYYVTFPNGKLSPGKYPAEKEYYPFLIHQLIQGVRRAKAALEPVKVEEASISVPSVLFNRRTIRLADGMVETNYLYPEHPDDFAFPSVDPELAVWRFRGKDGVLKAIVGRFSCHPVTGGQSEYGVSADYPGYFQSMVQKEFGCPGLFLLGNAGDAVPMQRNGESRRDIAEVLVRSIRLAERTFRQANDFRLEARIISVSARLRVRCSRRNVEGHLAKVFEENSGERFDWERCVMGCYQAEFAATYPKDRVELPLRLLRLGSKILVGMPFEVLTEIGVRLRDACPNTVLTSITGGYEGYLPLAKDYRRGGYETTLGSRFHRHAGDEFLMIAIQAVRDFENGVAK